MKGLRLSFILALLLSNGLLLSERVEAQSGINLFSERSAVSPGSTWGVAALSGQINRSLIASGAGAIEITLPDGRTLAVSRLDFERRGRGNFTWRGTTNPNTGLIDVTLTLQRGFVAGSIDFEGFTYEISPLKGRGQTYTLEKLDTSTLDEAPFDDGIAVPASGVSKPPDGSVSSRSFSNDQIHLLSVYSPQAETGAGGTAQIEAAIQSGVDVGNSAFINSDMDARFVLVHIEKVTRDDSGTGGTDLDWVRLDSGVAALRNTHGADLVSLVTETGSCGLGYVLTSLSGSPNYGFQVTRRNCLSNKTLAHEHGHNMGFAHNPENTGVNGIYTDSHGHYHDGVYRSVMSYSNPCTGGCPRVAHWSDPGILHEGLATGVTNERDNARTGRLSTPVVAAYRSAVFSSLGQTILVSESSDDAEEALPGGAMSLDSTDIELGDDPGANGDQAEGWRFNGVDIPQGVTITDAYITFTTDETDTTTTIVDIHAQAEDDAPTFTSTAGNISGRPLTTAMATWNIPAWNTVGEEHDSPDLTALVQEVISRPGWQPNNSIVFVGFGTGSRTSEAFDGSADKAARLFVEHNNTPYVTNVPPTANFTYSCTGLSCSFTDTSTDSDGTIASWAWDFDDGNIATTQNPNHVYAAPGTYNVSLTATDEDSATDVASQNVTVSIPSGSIDHHIKVDHFGYRPGDSKVVIFSANPGATVEIRNTANSTLYTVPTDGGSIQSKGNDGAPSGDDVWWVDFSGFSTAGTYRVYSSALGGQSYDFEIRQDIYNDVVRTALRSFYLQRCNTPKETLFAGAWDDLPSCHMSDLTAGPASGHTDQGTLDLTGGWHDAGDYNKYVWKAVSTAILTMLRAYTDNPGVFNDGESNIPESGSGIPDILDEIKWEIDWLLKMQLGTGSVLYQMHVDGFAWDSPPSADTNIRYYLDPTLESGSVFAGTMAHASRVFAAEGMTAYAATLETAAINAWGWLQTQGDSEEKVWAAAEVFAMDSSQTAARNYVDNFHTSQWSGRFLDPPHYDSHAALTYIQATGTTAAVVNNMRASVGAQVDYIFSNDDFYRNGMPSWAYYWSSNGPRAMYGLFLQQALKMGETGSYLASEVQEHSQDFLHFFHGQNPINMVYLTNMHSLGGEHSSWQFYHGWFGASGNTHSATNFFGKPLGISEPDYPYFKGTDNFGIDDNKSSLLGPAPGFVPGGPNKDYSGTGVPPGSAVYYNRFYRDWADQAEWTVVSWEITENSVGTQGPYVALGAYFMDPNVPPAAGFTDTPADLSVSFTNTSTDSDGTIASWSWDFGDTNSSTAQNPTHAYASGGTYNVTLTVTDDEGAIDAVSQNVTVAAATAQVTRGPYLQTLTDSSIIVRWRTDLPTDSVVRYGTSAGSLTTTETVAGSRTEHTVTLSLSDLQQYFYSIGETAGPIAGDATYHFTTAPVPGTSVPTRFWVIGDSGTAATHPGQAESVRDAFKTYSAASPADFWMMLGDNAYNDGYDSEYQVAVFDTYPELLRQSALWSTLGNHDGHQADSATQSGPYYDIFEFPTAGEAGGLASGTEAYYSYDYGNIHFVVLDSYETDRSVSGAMLTWMESDLAINDKPWVIAFWHHPPYSKGSHDSDTETRMVQMRTNALPILEGWGVDLVLSGHSHAYERSMLIDDHYGTSDTLNIDTMIKDIGDGYEFGDGVYEKPDAVAAQHEGAVYAVAGSSGKISGGPLNHTVMYINLNVLGSMVIDVDGDRLDAIFLDDSGTVRDEFSIQKSVRNLTPHAEAGPDQTVPDSDFLPGESITLDGSGSSDGDGTIVSYHWTWAGGSASGVGPTVSLPDGTTVVTLTVIDNEGATDGDIVTITLPPPGVIEVRVSQSSDDAEELVDPAPTQGYLTGHITTNSSDLEMVEDFSFHGGEQTIGIRFQNLLIPQGTTIRSASLVFGADETGSDATTLNINAEDVNNAATFTTASGSISSRPATTASVPWTIGAWNSTGQTHTSPDISAVVQEVTDRAGWASGNSMSFIITGSGKRVAEAYDGTSSLAPLLNVEFNIPPVADAGTDQNIPDSDSLAGEDVTLDGSGSWDIVGTIVSWDWTWTGGSTSGVGPTVNFPDGTNVVTLTVTDDNGATDMDTVSITVQPYANVAPTASFTYMTYNRTATFTDTSTDSDGSIVAWLWEFGDTNTSTAQNPVHVYAADGTYNVTLTVTDDDSDFNTSPPAGVTVTQDVTPPVITILGDNPASVDQHETYIDAGATALDNQDGDLTGSISITTPAIDTSVPGNQTVTYSVTDLSGNNETADRTVTVVANVAPTAAFTHVSTGLSVAFTDDSSDSDGSIVAWLWDFGDGNTSTSQNPVHVYAADGTYNVTLTVTDDDSAMDTSAPEGITVQDNIPPVITIVGDNPAFVDQYDTYTDAGATALDILDGDLTGSIIVTTPAIDTSIVGDQTVTYSVTDLSGNNATGDRTVTVVANVAPTASFTYLCDEVLCGFTDTSTDSDGTIGYWSWTFDDGSGAPVQNPVHGYLADGTYNVSLTVTDDDGDTSMVSQLVNVAWADGTQTLDIPVSQGSDDALEKNNSTVSVADTAIGLGSHAQANVSGFRFNNINIPQGTVINTAYITFTATETRSDTTTSTINGEDVDNAATFSASNGNISGRSLTSSSVPWTLPAFTSGSTYSSPELKTIVQEIVDRPSWAANNSLAFITAGSGRRNVHSFEGTGNAAVLHIETTSATGSCSASRSIMSDVWASIALPCHPGAENEVQDIFANLVGAGAIYDNDWFVWRYQASNDTYYKMALDSPMYAGQGYWVYSLIPTSLNFAGTANLLGDVNLVSEATEGQLNYLGNITNADQPWPEYQAVNADAVEVIPAADPWNAGQSAYECDMDPPGPGCLVSRTAYVWEAGSWQVIDAHSPGLDGDVKAGYGMFVESFKPGTMMRMMEPPTASPDVVKSEGSPSTTRAAITAQSDGGVSVRAAKDKGNFQPWFLRLIAESEHFSDSSNVFGQLEGSLPGNDSHDLEEWSPFGSRYLSLTFDSAALSEVDWGYTSDYRPLTKKPAGEWPVRIRASSDVGEITIRWEGDSGLLKNAVLRDEQTGVEHRMKQGRNYQFQNIDGDYHFTVILD